MWLLANIHQNIRLLTSWGGMMTPSMLFHGLRTVAGAAMLTATPAALAVNRVPVPPAFTVPDDPAGCVLEREGRPVDDAVLTKLGKQHGRQTVTLSASATIPYRCIGGILYRMQQAGFRRVNFHGM
ncbi:hypothetical protein ACQHGV_11260 [Sphingomonas pseudosanguinis]|uniref:hypothetical protein n=1 Tax=Sphingomonas pseudosanguinis TaxID=413712 RepID=UPI003F878A29